MAWDKVHLDCLIRGLGGPTFDLGIRLRDEALLSGDEGMFLEVLNILMRTFIKASAALNGTKKYRNIKYEVEKGLKQFYLELSKAASQMVMPPDQASFNARFLNNIPLKWKREMITHDRIRVDFSSNEEMIKAISCIDKIIDGLKMSSAYKLGYYTQTTTTVTTSHGKTLPPGKRSEEPKPRWKEDSSSKYSRKTDQKSVPICGKCGKIGQTKDCPKHYATSNEKPRRIAAMEVAHPSEEESEDSSEDKPENNSGDSEASSFEVEDPYEGPQYSPNSEGEEINVGTIRMGLMSVVDHNDTNYKIKLAVACQLENTADEKVAETLVEAPRKDALGKYMKVPKENKKKGKKDQKSIETQTPLFEAKLRISKDVGKYPVNRPLSTKRMLTAHVKIAGVKAYVLFDSGAETDAISPDFVHVVHIPILQLENPVVLQMGTKGTRSQILFGTNMDVEINSHVEKHYFDVINIDRYDAIFGAPWLNKNQVSLDFRSHRVRMANKGNIDTLGVGEDCAMRLHGWKT